MKLLVYQRDRAPIELECERFEIEHADDHYSVRESNKALMIRIEEHKGSLAMDLAVFPHGGSSIRLKGGLRHD